MTPGSAISAHDEPVTVMLRCLMSEAHQRIDPGALTELAFQAGVRAGREIPPRRDLSLEGFHHFARTTLAALGFSDVDMNVRPDGMEFVHHGRGGQVWLGEGAADWFPSFMRGLYREWIRQMGSEGNLDFRPDPGFGDESSDFRMSINRVALANGGERHA